MTRGEVARLLALLAGPLAESVSLRQLKAAFTEVRLQRGLTDDDAVSLELFSSLDHHLTTTGLRLPDLWAQVRRLYFVLTPSCTRCTWCSYCTSCGHYT
jgi:hypothetical protein